MQISYVAALSRIVSALAMLAFFTSPALAAQVRKAPAKKASFNATTCYTCHEPIKAFHTAGKHAGVGCDSCHGGLDKHLGEPTARPSTKVDPATCGTCHENQFRTMYTMNWDKPARFEKSQAIGPSPNPAWDKLMMPHGFTREHNVPRSHAFMVLDQYDT